MDQIKIGKFIASCRKARNMTQMQLAEKMGVSDRAVSKWETGKSMPDASIMQELCSELGITINDLFSGEVVTMDNYKEEYEKNLIDMAQQKEQSDRSMLRLEVVIGCLSVFILLSLTFIAAYVEMEAWLRTLSIVCGFVVCMIGLCWAIRIEQVAGYYECGKCHHKYVPTYTATLFAMHINRTRYLKCPACSRYSWHKKVLKKD